MNSLSVLQRAAAKAIDAAKVEAEQLELLGRTVALVRAGVLGVVIADSGKVYLCENRLDPWGTKFLISFATLLDLVEAGERAMGSRLLRKPAASETGGAVDGARRIG